MQTGTQHLDIGGHRLFVQLWQPDGGRDAAPVLLFHDSLGSVELWRDLPQRLAEGSGRVVIAYDRAGFGRSAPRAGRPPLDFIAQEAGVAAALADALGFGRFVAAGHSVGGGMAVETAAALPDRVAGLMTISAQAFVEDVTAAGIRVAKAMFAAPENLTRIARYHGDKARWVVDAWTECWLHPDFARWSLDAALAQVRCPALVIHGGNDEYGSTAHPHRIADATGARLVLIDGAGHLPHRETPDQVIGEMTAFLRGIG